MLWQSRLLDKQKSRARKDTRRNVGPTVIVVEASESAEATGPQSQVRILRGQSGAADPPYQSLPCTLLERLLIYAHVRNAHRAPLERSLRESTSLRNVQVDSEMSALRRRLGTKPQVEVSRSVKSKEGGDRWRIQYLGVTKRFYRGRGWTSLPSMVSVLRPGINLSRRIVGRYLKN